MPLVAQNDGLDAERASGAGMCGAVAGVEGAWALARATSGSGGARQPERQGCGGAGRGRDAAGEVNRAIPRCDLDQMSAREPGIWPAPRGNHCDRYARAKEPSNQRVREGRRPGRRRERGQPASLCLESAENGCTSVIRDAQIRVDPYASARKDPRALAKGVKQGADRRGRRKPDCALGGRAGGLPGSGVLEPEHVEPGEVRAAGQVLLGCTNGVASGPPESGEHWRPARAGGGQGHL